MAYIFTARIGHNVGNKKDALHTMEIVETAQNVLGIENCTAYEATGCWRGDYEKTTVIEVCGLDDEQAQALMERLPELAGKLEQTSIYGTVQKGRCEERFASEHEDGRITATM